MEIDNVIAALAALAQPVRLQVYRFLVQAGGAGLPAGQIAQRFDLPSPTLSFHLNQLRAARLVTRHREGRSIIYSANYTTMTALLAYLTDNCCSRAPCGVEAAACSESALADESVE